MMNGADVAIVGGGVIGCAAAWDLARAGMRVELFECGRLGGEATSAAAGMLAPLAESHEPGPFTDLALAGLRAFAEDMPSLVEDSRLDPEYRISGVLRLAMDEVGARSLHGTAAWQANADLDLRWLEPRQVASLEPRLAPCLGALLSPHEGHVNPARLNAALATAAANRGAILHEYCAPVRPWIEHGRVRGVMLGDEPREAGHVVLAAGAWSGPWAEALGLRIPIRPVKGQMLQVQMLPQPLSHVVFGGHSYLVPRVDGSVYVGATMEDAGFDRRATVAGLSHLAASAKALLPALGAAEPIRSGAGLRPGTADGLPVIGPVPGMESVITATGHFRNGILLSLITGRIVAALVRGQEPALPLAPFSPGRFAGLTT